MQDHITSINLPTEQDTKAMAKAFAELLVPGDTVLLFGNLGAGKSFFARSLIQSRFGTEIDVPSPTFTLVQTYEHPDGDIWHCDLYRLTDPIEVVELGLDDAFDDSICLIEWPEKLDGTAPDTAISIYLSQNGSGRSAKILGSNPRLAQILAQYD